jgi:hypothetical protein
MRFNISYTASAVQFTGEGVRHTRVQVTVVVSMRNLAFDLARWQANTEQHPVVRVCRGEREIARLKAPSAAY